MNCNVGEQMKYQKQPLEEFYKKGVVENFLKFTERHLWQSLFYNKGLPLRLATQIRDSGTSSIGTKR